MVLWINRLSRKEIAEDTHTVAFPELVKQAAKVEVAGENSEAEFRVFVANWKDSMRVQAALFFQSNYHL